MISDVSKACVLIVEDEPIIALDLKLMLEDFGVCVIGPALTLAEAEGFSERGDIALAILDIQPEGQTITPVADRLAERDVPLIFHTGQIDADRIAARWPRAKVLSKPANEGDLLSAISEFLGPVTPRSERH